MIGAKLGSMLSNVGTIGGGFGPKMSKVGIIGSGFGSKLSKMATIGAQIGPSGHYRGWKSSKGGFGSKMCTPLTPYAHFPKTCQYCVGVVTLDVTTPTPYAYFFRTCAPLSHHMLIGVNLDTLSHGKSGRFFGSIDKFRGSSGKLALSARTA